MGCYFPVGCYCNDGSLSYRPCGKCLGCRLEYSKQWAARCVHEASLHEANSFITLTYNDEHLPKNKSIDRKELQKFIRRLRKKIAPDKIRFFACGEYGEKFTRPHYHACLFGYDFPDKQVLKTKRFQNPFVKKLGNRDLDILYTSELLGKVWEKGFHSIGKMSFESAAYVARYVTKKINGKQEASHYGDKTPEFALMSRRPGIGKKWIEKYLTDCYPKDFHTINGIKMRPCRFYDEVCKERYPEMFEKVKEKRKEAAEEQPYQNDKRRIQRQLYRKNVTSRLERELENG